MAGARFNYQPAPAHIMERVRRIESVCARHGVTLPAAALQFVLAHPAVKSVIPGAMAAQEVRQNVALLEESIPQDFWADLKETQLLRGDAPVPAG